MELLCLVFQFISFPPTFVPLVIYFFSRFLGPSIANFFSHMHARRCRICPFLFAKRKDYLWMRFLFVYFYLLSIDLLQRIRLDDKKNCKGNLMWMHRAIYRFIDTTLKRTLKKELNQWGNGNWFSCLISIILSLCDRYDAKEEPYRCEVARNDVTVSTHSCFLSNGALPHSLRDPDNPPLIARFFLRSKTNSASAPTCWACKISMIVNRTLFALMPVLSWSSVHLTRSLNRGRIIMKMPQFLNREQKENNVFSSFFLLVHYLNHKLLILLLSSFTSFAQQHLFQFFLGR